MYVCITYVCTYVLNGSFKKHWKHMYVCTYARFRVMYTHTLFGVMGVKMTSYVAMYIHMLSLLHTAPRSFFTYCVNSSKFNYRTFFCCSTVFTKKTFYISFARCTSRNKLLRNLGSLRYLTSLSFQKSEVWLWIEIAFAVFFYIHTQLRMQ
jgi:hypothetical protein